jgi:DNA recombination protein RmuC
MILRLSDLLLLLVAALPGLGVLWLVVRSGRLAREQADGAARLNELLDARHREMLRDLHDGLNALGDRVLAAGAERADALRRVVDEQLRQTRDALAALQLSSQQELGASRDAMRAGLGEQRETLVRALLELRTEMLEKSLAALAEQARTQSESLRDSLHALSRQLTGTIETLTRTADARLEQIQGKVHERLEAGFRQTNETFTSVMARLATIDEAQRKIDGLAGSVLSLNELLGDKRSRGAFGEVQLETLVRNLLPPTGYAFQHTLSNRHRADCVLTLPPPTGVVAIDSKFPLENYHRMFDAAASAQERRDAQKAFRADVRRHVDDIAARYIVPGETTDGAVMFVPAEAVFAEIHAYHGEVVDHAMHKRVWIVSPTTMMAVLNTARAVLRDTETRHQVHVIKDELARLGKDFGRFDERMRRLAAHIKQAHDDAANVQISSDKIVRRFRQIEQAELPAPEAAASLPAVPHAAEEG